MKKSTIDGIIDMQKRNKSLADSLRDAMRLHTDAVSIVARLWNHMGESRQLLPSELINSCVHLLGLQDVTENATVDGELPENERFPNDPDFDQFYVDGLPEDYEVGLF